MFMSLDRYHFTLRLHNSKFLLLVFLSFIEPIFSWGGLTAILVFSEKRRESFCNSNLGRYCFLFVSLYMTYLKLVRKWISHWKYIYLMHLRGEESDEAGTDS